MKFNLLSDNIIFQKFFTIKERILNYDHFDGSRSKDVIRFIIDKGPAVASILYLKDIDKYVFVEQLRTPLTLIDKENPWIMEIVAGTIDGNDTPRFTAEKEIHEEAGFLIDELTLLQKIYLTPGISTELVYLYYATALSTRTTPTGDPEDEEEDIKLHYLTIEEVKSKVDAGEFIDAKTALAAHYIVRRHGG